MVLLSSDGFLARLPQLFAETQKSGSVFITVKRVVPRGEEDKPARTMYRAATTARKISTVLSAEEAPKFHAACIAVLKANMTGLQKKPKKKRGGAQKAAEDAAH